MLILMLPYHCTHANSLLGLLLHHPAHALNLLHQIARPLPAPPRPLRLDLGSFLLQRDQRRRVAVDLLLHGLGSQTRRAAAALDALVALADARAQAAEVVRVARAPGPAAQIGRVGGAERLAAGLAEPDHGGAGAGGAQEGGGGESGRGGGDREEGSGWGRGRRAAAVAAGAGPAGRGELGQRGARAGAAEAAMAAVEHGDRGWLERAVLRGESS